MDCFADCRPGQLAAGRSAPGRIPTTTFASPGRSSPAARSTTAATATSATTAATTTTPATTSSSASSLATPTVTLARACRVIRATRRAGPRLAARGPRERGRVRGRGAGRGKRVAMA